MVNKEEAKDIFEKYIHGDNHAIADLYKITKEKLLLTSYRYCRNTDTSKDIVHDVFEKLLKLSNSKRVELFTPWKNNVIGYLVVCVTHKTIDHLRNRNSRNKILKSLQHTISEKTDNESFNLFLNDYFNELLNGLEPREKEIISLHMKGYKNDEIASFLKISYATVKNKIYDARIKLKYSWKFFLNT